MTTTALAPKSTLTLPGKFELLGTTMNSFLIERKEEVEITKLALAAKEHAFLYGEPGVAKTYLIDLIKGLVGGLTDDDVFHNLFFKSTTREDVFGPLDLNLLDQGHYYFKPEGYMPNAKIVVGDEFWKANAAIQNAHLWAVNERKYRNDGKIYNLPLWSMFIASNEVPSDDDGLRAIYDRFLLRKIVSRIAEDQAFIEMLKMAEAVLTPVIDWSDIEAGHEEVLKVEIPDEVYDAIVELKAEMATLDIFPSDRRWRWAMKIVRAQSWLAGQQVAEVEHLQVLRFVLWDDPKEFRAVEGVCLKMSNPIEAEIMKILDDLDDLGAQTERAIADSPDLNRRLAAGNELYGKINETRDELVAIDKRLDAAGKTSVKLDQASNRLNSLGNRVLTKLYGTSLEEVKEGMEAHSKEIQ